MHQLDLRQKEKNANLKKDFKQHRPLNQVPSEESGIALKAGLCSLYGNKSRTCFKMQLQGKCKISFHCAQ